MKLTIESCHRILLTDPGVGFVQDTDGHLQLFSDFISPFYDTSRGHSSISRLDIYPGSFNPLHETHRAIYYHMKKNRAERLFELSINRFDKPALSLKELEDRLKQFLFYAPVLITNVSKFLEKAGVVRCGPPVTFHVGADTIHRILQHHSKSEVEGMNCSFVCYDRMAADGSGGQLKTGIPMPSNCKRGEALSESLMKVSSTEIRAKSAKELIVLLEKKEEI